MKTNEENPILQLKRFTTKYNEVEDRIQIAGESLNKDIQTILLTNRLLKRTVLALIDFIDPKPEESIRSEIKNSFAQQAARQAHLVKGAQAPVKVSEKIDSWLVVSIDLKRNGKTVSLLFKGSEGQKVNCDFSMQALRQWINILYDLWLRAAWPVDFWPEWVKSNRLQESANEKKLH